MPPKRIGKGAQARYDAKKPMIAFRAPSVAYKQRVKKAAQERGLTMHEFLRRAVGAYMEAPLDAQRSFLNKTKNLKVSSLGNATLHIKHGMDEAQYQARKAAPEKTEGTKKAIEQINWDEFIDDDID